jgi:hypothetical protein
MDTDAPPVFPGTPFGPSRNPGERGTRDPGRTRLGETAERQNGVAGFRWKK